MGQFKLTHYRVCWLVGGTSFHRWIHGASLGRNAGKPKTLCKNKRNEPAPRMLDVCLGRTDNVIEGGHALTACTGRDELALRDSAQRLDWDLTCGTQGACGIPGVFCKGAPAFVSYQPRAIPPPGQFSTALVLVPYLNIYLLLTDYLLNAIVCHLL